MRVLLSKKFTSVPVLQYFNIKVPNESIVDYILNLKIKKYFNFESGIVVSEQKPLLLISP